MHCNGANSYLFVNGTEIYKFKLNGYFYDFSVDYDAIAGDNILDIHNYLIKKNDIESDHKMLILMGMNLIISF